LFPHVSAAIQLSNEDNHPSKGDTIKYIYTNSQHKNPLCRVIPVHNSQENNGKSNYDKEKYKEMILDAAETAKRKWWWVEELRQERKRDISRDVRIRQN
jgi:DNA polymerase elongation subunit (family B)